MKINVLASGSKGNSTLLEVENEKILIDLGISNKKLEEKLKEISVDVNEINDVLITHDHKDHTNGIKVFSKKRDVNFYFSNKMESINLIENKNKIKYYKKKNNLNNIEFYPLKLSHDANDTYGFIIKSKTKKMAYITDTGYINEKYFEKLENLDLYIIESNHDINMLMQNSYPFYLKQRILGDKGHLSNKDTAFYLSKLIGENTKKIVLAHLSKESNNNEIAYKETKKMLEEKGYSSVVLKIAEQEKIIKVEI